MSKKIRRLSATALLWISFFVVACLVECGIRAFFVEEISTSGESPDGLVISGKRKPDFLWWGYAWWVDYSSKESFYLDFGDGVDILMPAGEHSIYSNHDYSNTSDYGIEFSGDYPTDLKVIK